MIMSRAEIAAAARALRRDVCRRVQSAEFVVGPRRSVPVATFVSECAAQVRAEPVYRLLLVTRLQSLIDRGTYVLPADEIADQLLGRLVAAELAH